MLSSYVIALAFDIKNPIASKEKATYGGFMAYPQTVKIVFIIMAAVLAVAIIALLIRRKKEGSEDRPSSISRTNTLEKPHKPNSSVVYASAQHMGRRQYQQDSYSISSLENKEFVERKGILAVVADGIGGLSSGDQISGMIVLSFMKKFASLPPEASPSYELMQMLYTADEEVNDFLGARGIKKSGSTVVASIIRNGHLSWISVGDSRIALYRNGALIEMNRPHVFGTELDLAAIRGEMGFNEAQAYTNRGNLTSYIGMGAIKYVDYSMEPIKLCSGDRVILMTDGVFGTITNEEISEILTSPVQDAAEEIKNRVLSKEKPNQDNFTAVIMEYE